MAHATTHDDDYGPEEALRRIKAERTSRSWIAVILFTLSAIALATSFYLSYREAPAPDLPAKNAPGLLDPYH